MRDSVATGLHIAQKHLHKMAADPPFIRFSAFWLQSTGMTSLWGGRLCWLITVKALGGAGLGMTAMRHGLCGSGVVSNCRRHDCQCAVDAGVWSENIASVAGHGRGGEAVTGQVDKDQDRLLNNPVVRQALADSYILTIKNGGISPPFS